FFGAIRALHRKRVLEAKAIKNILAALFEFVNQVGIIQSRQARVCNRVTGKLVSSVCKRDYLLPGNALPMARRVYVLGRRLEHSLTNLGICLIHKLIRLVKILALVE